MAAHAVCLIVAGVLRAAMPAEEFTLEWQHSVQKTHWVERYRIEDHALVLVEARVQGSGAGMEVGDGAVLKEGWWAWQPRTRLAELTVRASSYTPDYLLCTAHGCRELRELVRAQWAETPIPKGSPAARGAHPMSEPGDAHNPVTLRPCRSRQTKG